MLWKCISSIISREEIDERLGIINLPKNNIKINANVVIINSQRREEESEQQDNRERSSNNFPVQQPIFIHNNNLRQIKC